MMSKKWKVFFGASLGCVTTVTAVWGATYNFYFNNTEQGPNSTASPSLSVVDGKPSSSGAQKTVTNLTEGDAPAAKTEVPAVASAQAPAVAKTASSTHVEPKSDDDSHFWRFGLSAGFVGWQDSGSVNGPYYGGGSPTNNRGVALLSLGLFPAREIGLNLFAGIRSSGFDDNVTPIFGGAEIEIVPLKISIFRATHLLEFAALGGVSKLTPTSEGVHVHVGARATINLGERWGIMAAGRISPSTPSVLMADAGLIFRL